HVCGREKEQRRCTKQFCLTVQSAVAWSQLLMPSERGWREESASCCDPDKGPRERQVHPPSSGTCQTRARQGGQRFTCLRVATNRSIGYHRSMVRVRIRLARSVDCRALAELRYRFRAEDELVTETKSRFVRRCTSWMKKR